MVDGQVGARAAVLAGPVVAGEHGAAGDLAPMRVAGHADVADQADDDRARDARALRAQEPVGVLDHLGLLLEQEDDRAADGADVDRLIRGVQNEHPATAKPAPLVLSWRRGPPWVWWN